MSLNSIVHRGYDGGTLDTVVRRGYAAYTGLPQPPASGYQYETCTSATWTGTSLSQGSVPAVAVGDVFIGRLVTSPSSFPITINGDGTLDENAGGNTSRQSLQYAIYRVAGNVIDPSNFPSSTGIFWINEIGPVWNQPILLRLTVGVPMSAINLNVLNPYVFSPEGDALIYALIGSWLPAGISLTAGVISGIPTTAQTVTGQINAIDITGTTTTSPTCQFTVSSGAPVWQGVNIFPSPIPVGVGIVPLNLNSYFTDLAGNAMTFALASGALPTGLSLSANMIVGTPDALGSFSFVISATDNVTGLTTNSPVQSASVIIAMLNLVGLELQQAIANLQSAGIYVPAQIGYFGNFPISVDWVKSNQQPNIVLTQSIASGTTPIMPNMPIALTVSQFTFGVSFP
jgi:hypothetical protein